MEQTCTAFGGDRRIAAGSLAEVAVAVKAAQDADPDAPVLVFDDRTGRQIDFDLRGTAGDVAARYAPAPESPRSPGRPRLGVVAREVTLLPRHWDWLAAQPGGASVALRKLVETARSAGNAPERVRDAQAAADRFMTAMLGNAQGYEEASRALYAGDAERFSRLTQSWPADPRDHLRALAAPAFERSCA